ncbi:Cytochrome P450 [Macleaya cordata]|uniref:Cytochrome P450 n=1 Tax=Macleaya cordata TaxID=56857 RepID=A0A200PQD4_MACCD|nr:Cytochrome P450 [Macleaya cordata]
MSQYVIQNTPNIKLKTKLPPGPFTIPILSDLQWLPRSFADLEPFLRNLRSNYGPIITFRIGHNKAIFIASPNLAHQALIQNGAFLADRPPPPETSKVISSNQHNIVSASYDSIWRLLRRNLTNHILHPSKIKSYSPALKWVMEILKKNLRAQSQLGQPVRIIDHFQHAMFCLIVSMCFGEELRENKIREIESVLTTLSLGFTRFNILDFFPKLLGNILFKSLLARTLRAKK